MLDMGVHKLPMHFKDPINFHMVIAGFTFLGALIHIIAHSDREPSGPDGRTTGARGGHGAAGFLPSAIGRTHGISRARLPH